MSPDQKEQFEAYKKDLMNQIRERRDILQSEREQAKQDGIVFPGLKIGEYNPNFRDLLKSELEKQIEERRSKTETEKSRKLADEKERVRRLTEAGNRKDQETLNQQVSMKKKLKDMVKGDYDKAWSQKGNKNHQKLIDKDVVPEFDIAAAGMGIGHVEDVTLDTPTRIRKFHELHNVNRYENDEDDYWFVKRLMENEQQIVHTEEKNKRNVHSAMQKMMHEEVSHHPKKVIVGSKLKNKH